MKTLLRLLLALALVLLPLAEAAAGSSTITTKDASGTTKTFFVTTDGSGNFYAAGVICDQSAAAACASVGTAGSPSTNALTVQAVTLGHGTAANAMRVELPTDGTGLVNAAQSGTWNIGTVTTVTGVTTVSTVTALTTLTGGGVASAAADSGNPLKVGGKYNSSPITLTDGNRGDLQLDVNGYVKINVTNANANGSAVSASSSPVVIASDQVAVAVKAASGVFASGSFASGALASGSVASGAYASGSIGSGAVASGAYASGAVASGAYASGSLASGAVVDITNMSATTAGAVPAKALYHGVNVGGNLVGIVGDPCQTNAKNYQTISQTTNTQLFAGTSSKKTYVCHIIVVGADAENISLVSGTGSVCATSTAAVIGSTTAAAGPNLSANGGFSIGNGGYAVAVSAVNADNVCLFQSGSGRVAGVMSYVAQ